VVVKVDPDEPKLLDFADDAGVRNPRVFVRYPSPSSQHRDLAWAGWCQRDVVLLPSSSGRSFERTGTKSLPPGRRASGRRDDAALGYDGGRQGRRLLVTTGRAERVRAIFGCTRSTRPLLRRRVLVERGLGVQAVADPQGHERGGKPFTRNSLYGLRRKRRLLGSPAQGAGLTTGARRWSGGRVSTGSRPVMKEERGDGRGPRSATSSAPMKGFLRCGRAGAPCRRRIHPQGNRRYRYYAARWPEESGGAGPAVQVVPPAQVDASSWGLWRHDPH